jgi:formylglycine-generating enzyme required for sulfatase activity
MLPDRAPSPPGAEMMWIPGGTFRMGSEDFYPDESPVHEVSVDGFWMDRYAITNAQFADFVATTGYVTFAERPLEDAVMALLIGSVIGMIADIERMRSGFITVGQQALHTT